ncbi:MAG: 7-cyano-7-deazaguanine synthase [Candidatus Aenigmarchaeota archaeon]|nr:7-cyano-7-deazaguanine synthase [Candidatus Aenigmarchaeota archaeon]
MKKKQVKVKVKRKALLLLSGGIDSPVAGWMMKRKTYDIEAIHFSYEPLTDGLPEEKSRRICEILGIKKIIVIRISKQLKEISEKINRKYYFVIQKRLMYRIAERVAKKLGCSFLLTGESLGQVSSQTLQNLAVIDQATRMVVLRPLICFDKDEIVEKAREIGTYEISIGKEYCDVLGPEKPSTQARIEIILEEEKKANVERLTEETIKDMERGRKL